jgi:malate synthase
VVPVLNARFLLNAANARWGSLYDALYGTDAIVPPEGPARGYDQARGANVIAYTKAFLDDAVPLAQGRHADASGYAVRDGALSPPLANPAGFAAYRGIRPTRRLSCCATTVCTSSWCSIAGIRSARTFPPVSPTWCSKRR